MKVCHIDRNVMYLVLSHAFKALSIQPRCIELGVCKGDNAQRLLETLSPPLLVLVDSWNTLSNKAYSPFEQLPPWVDPPEKYDFYFGGPTSEQATWDRLYEDCASRFASQPSVRIVRAGTIDALPLVRDISEGRPFDLIYVDASHQYEYVLRDLLYYQELLSPDGCFVLNDCCHSDAGTRQNLGVLEAVGSFIKRKEFVPVALTNTDWTDLVLTRKGNRLEQAIHWSLVHSDVAFVDLPHQLMTAARVVQGSQRVHLSFV